jgi:ATP-dependent DNA helicase RecG
MNKFTKLEEIRGVGEKTSALFASRGLFTAGDLIACYPTGYDRYDPPVLLSEAKPWQVVTLSLSVIGGGSTARAGKRTINHFQAGDRTGKVRLSFFNMPYLRGTLAPGTGHIFRGLLKTTKTGLYYMEQPQIFTPEKYAAVQNTMQPRYSLTKGLKNQTLVKAIRQVLEGYAFPADYLDEKERKEYVLIGQAEAVRKIHFPLTEEDVRSARRRLIFDEFFSFILTVRRQKAQAQDTENLRPMKEVPLTQDLIGKLPFQLTQGQQKAWKEIQEDLSGRHVMNRLLQGDVGSGKTILAFLALIMTAGNGRQGALMAPTEVLAGQHMKALCEMAEKYDLPVHPVLLTGSVKARERKKIYGEIASGKADIIIGTHALFQEAVEYHDLGLVITDEQHRFGVRQREGLADKGKEVPVLVMSATPIPRTLAIILYGDLQISELRELPADRLPIKNLAMEQGQRDKALRFLYRQVLEGRQVYVICPAVEPPDPEDMEDPSGLISPGTSGEMENVTDYTQMLREVFPPQIRIDSLHGRMKSADKEAAMERFAAHETDILVSTTVIEVGINVPNATVMLVENAERFGLSQLHQIRGRVGRGKDQSYCIFLYAQGKDRPERLDILVKNNDGFTIAEEDLKLRGPGDIFGVRQSGDLGFIMADIYADSGVMKLAAACVDRKLAKDSAYGAGIVKSVDFRTI